MIYVRPEEIEEVNKNLKIFEGFLKDKFIENLLNPQEIRYKKHGLFFSLCNPMVFPFLQGSLTAIKNYENGEYFPKAVKKLVGTNDWLEHKSVVAEIIVVGYYFDKFKKDKNIKVIWERPTADSGRNVDISILGWVKNINIEITALHNDAEYRNFFELRDDIKIALEQMTESFKNQKYAYIFSLPAKSSFSKKDIPNFVHFVRSVREIKGLGKYKYEAEGKTLAFIDIFSLNRLKKEYASNIDIFSRWNEDSKRIQDKISEKVNKQLPKGEINFVCIAALDVLTDDYEAEQAILGSEKITINLNTGEGKLGREADDISKILSQEGYKSLYALIYFNWDYSRKKIIGNPTKRYEGVIKEAVELIT